MKKMKKKRMSLIRVVTSLALAAILCLGLSMPAFATEDPPNISEGSESADATAVITKQLTMAEGTKTPRATYTFDITGIVQDGSITDPEVNSVLLASDPPSVGPKAIDYFVNDPGDLDENTGMITVTKTIDIFSSVDWKHAGVYGYVVGERPSGGGEGVTYSQAQYNVYVYVANKSDGSGLYVSAISAWQVKDESGAIIDNPSKVNPGPVVSGGPSSLVFVNKLIETIDGTDPTDPNDQALNISKTVTGEHGDKTKYFTFDLELTKAPSLTADPTYQAYVVEGNTALTNLSDNYKGDPGSLSSDTHGAFIKVTTGIPITFMLKHGQSLVFTKMDVGTEYEAVETGEPNYTPSVVITEGGIQYNLDALAGYSLSTTGTDEVLRIVEAVGDGAAFTNQYATVSPTGIIVDNLAYIVLLVTLLLGFGAFMVVKSRKRARSEQ